MHSAQYVHWTDSGWYVNIGLYRNRRTKTTSAAIDYSAESFVGTYTVYRYLLQDDLKRRRVGKCFIIIIFLLLLLYRCTRDLFGRNADENVFAPRLNFDDVPCVYLRGCDVRMIIFLISPRACNNNNLIHTIICHLLRWTHVACIIRPHTLWHIYHNRMDLIYRYI